MRTPYRPNARDQAINADVMSDVLHRLPKHHRRAIADYFLNHATAEEAASTARMGVEAFRELKRNVKASFAAAIRQPCESFGDTVATAAGGRGGHAN